jgi:hypothetical protein
VAGDPSRTRAIRNRIGLPCPRDHEWDIGGRAAPYLLVAKSETLRRPAALGEGAFPEGDAGLIWMRRLRSHMTEIGLSHIGETPPHGPVAVVRAARQFASADV